MIEGARDVVEVGAQIPEILERHLAIELAEEDLTIAPKVVLRECAQRSGVILEPGPRLRLPVDHPREARTAIRIAEPSGIVRVVRRGFPAVFEIEQQVAF